MRLVLDTNVLVSGLLFPGGPPSRIIAAWRGGAFDLVVSDFLVDELVRIVQHLAPRLKFTAAELDDFLDTLRLRSEMVQLDADSLAQTSAAELRNPDDVPILAMLISAAADFLVTGDKDLLASAGAYPILTPAEFEARFLS